MTLDEWFAIEESDLIDTLKILKEQGYRAIQDLREHGLSVEILTLLGIKRYCAKSISDISSSQRVFYFYQFFCFWRGMATR